VARSRAAQKAATILARLRVQHPDAHCELVHRDAFTLLVSVVLSAQTTDVAVNQVTPALFARWPDAASLAGAAVADVEATINRIGMYRQKARNIVALSRELVARHDGQVPNAVAALVALPGVGRKTANVVLGVAFGAPDGVVVDTHVLRLSQRLGWTKHDDPAKVERDLVALFPREQWDLLGHTVIFHGRRICTARRPACEACSVHDLCPSAHRAVDVGRKAPRPRGASAGTTG